MQSKKLLKGIISLASTIFLGTTIAMPIMKMQKPQQSDKPNIIFILTDQFRYESLPWIDKNVKAPNLERLAREGIDLTHAYSQNPQCSPNRASIITSRYSSTHGLYKNSMLLKPDEDSIAEVYKRNGYKTGYIGKWHLDNVKDKPGFVPPERRQGFDFWAAFNAGHFYWDTKYYLNDDNTIIRKKGYEPEIQTDIALEFINKHAEDPFCLFLSWGPPHTPLYPPKGIDERFDKLQSDNIQLRPDVPETEYIQAKKETAGYNLHINLMDEQLGRILDDLEEKGIRDNTIVVFTSDHGDMLGSLGLYRKGFEEELSIHVPFVISYPDKLKQNTSNDMLFGAVDYMPTLLSLSGITPPKGIEGNDFSKALIKNAKNNTQDSIYIQFQNATKKTWRAVRTQRYLYSEQLDASTLKYLPSKLYDLEADPYQFENCINKKEYKDIQNKLHMELRAYANKFNDQLYLNPQSVIDFHSKLVADED